MRKKGIIIIIIGLGALGLIIWLAIGNLGGKKEATPAPSSGVSFGSNKTAGNSSGSGGTSSGTSQSPSMITGSGSLPSNNDVQQAAGYAISQAFGGNYTVTSTTQPSPGWFISTVSVPGTDDQTLILKTGPNGLQLVEGPGTSFARSSLINDGVPQAIQDQVLVYDDN